MRRAYSEQILSTTETTALQVATPGPRPALAGAHKEHVLLQLLQRAADTPEELLLYTSELTTAGLLSRTVIEQLCSSLGVRPEVLAAAAGGTPVPTDADAAAPPPPTTPARGRRRRRRRRPSLGRCSRRACCRRGSS